MKRDNLVFYDMKGTIIAQTGEAEGDILPHVYPVGIPYIEIPFGTMAVKRLISIDISKTPHTPIFEEIPHLLTDAEKIAQLENELLIAKGVI